MTFPTENGLRIKILKY